MLMHEKYFKKQYRKNTVAAIKKIEKVARKLFPAVFIRTAARTVKLLSF